MKAAVVHALGRSPTWTEFADPEPQPGETAITVSAAALSQLARSRASGAHYSSSGQFPFVAGVDGVGRRDDGARVYFLLPRPPHGAFAQRTVAPAGRCLPLPDGLDDVTAAAIANPGLSSWAAFSQRARLQRGEAVLVNGATGAAGSLAVAIARHFGARRVVATGRDVKALEAVGADAVIPLGAEESAIQSRLQAEFALGIDVVIDYLWGVSAERLLVAAARADAGPLRFVQVGAASGGDITLPSAALRSSATTLMGSGVGSVAFDRLVECTGEMLAAAAAARWTIPTRTAPLAEVEKEWGRDGVGARLVFTM